MTCVGGRWNMFRATCRLRTPPCHCHAAGRKPTAAGGRGKPRNWRPAGRSNSCRCTAEHASLRSVSLSNTDAQPFECVQCCCSICFRTRNNQAFWCVPEQDDRNATPDASLPYHCSTPLCPLPEEGQWRQPKAEIRARRSSFVNQRDGTHPHSAKLALTQVSNYDHRL